MRERIAKERREAQVKARARFSGSLHVEDLEGDLKRTWGALKSRIDKGHTASLMDVAEELQKMSDETGASEEDTRAEAQVTALVSTLFLTNRGYVTLSQQQGKNGRIELKDLWSESNDYDKLTSKLHPKSEIGVIDNV